VPFKHAFVKQYEKFSTFLGHEICSNNLSDFRLKKGWDRNWTTMNEAHNSNTAYDIGTGAAHLDFFSPERYSPVLLWPDDRPWGLVTAYSRYRTGGKPVQWTEFGADVSTTDGSSTSQATQGLHAIP
jgi:hypothetical protein